MNAPTPMPLDEATLNGWTDAPLGPVALTLRQVMQPVEGPGSVIFPPTYADLGYCIDRLSDGTRVALIDSVGSQANRMEPLFKHKPYSDLVPKVTIALGNGKVVDLLDVGHRLGDALVRASGLSEAVRDAFHAFTETGSAVPIAKLAPTSLVFGAWDSRGEGSKLPRLVSSTIRAWDVDPIHRAAQYNPPADYAALDVFSDDEKKKAEGNVKSPLAQRGFVHVPAVGEKGQGGELGGVLARGDFVRSVTVNLVALRALRGESEETTAALRRYILGLALVTATDPGDAFLRQGCLLTPDPETPADWTLVARSGQRQPVALTPDAALAFAQQAATSFGVGQSQENVPFDKIKAKADLKAKDGRS
ncbi:type I-G CRISPR-associated RAMP protein Csb1/Cas7g [Rhodospira trueperi]|uniref:CRISPR-associated protein Csb1 n=1 Tax=Rhodospira trueperi TaxID=69960 RepID=A0A1G7EG19_9PROT|nr:type I-U CRISPR-associated RAMP protein Csb1/Cas7u [Rhodospira trueperi]SDE62547.1 CRISPR-associated protein Csb1 [Rhodospira trueperi]